VSETETEDGVDFLSISRTIPLNTSERARTGVAALVQHARAYEYERDHAYGKRIHVTKSDFYLEVGMPLALLVLWWVDERGAAAYLSVWEEGEMRRIAEGDLFGFQFSCVVPVMRAAGALDCIWRVLGAARVSWREAEHLKIEKHQRWSSPDEAAFCMHPQHFIMVAKLECFLCAPDQVEASEVLDYLPHAGSCKWARDRFGHIFSSTESLGVVISKAALACGTLCSSRVCLLGASMVDMGRCSIECSVECQTAN
jgi:hypothetical protein